MMRAILSALTIAFVVAIVAASTHETTVEVFGARTVQTVRSRGYLKAKAGLLQQPVESASAAVGTPTDPPFTQPKEFIMLGSNFCRAKFTRSGSMSLYNAHWVTEPSMNIEPFGESGGFIVKHDAGSVAFNGTLQYTDPNSEIPIMMAFAAVQNEWEFELEYASVLNVTLLSADIGVSNLYSIVFGDFSLPAGVTNC